MSLFSVNTDLYTIQLASAQLTQVLNKKGFKLTFINYDATLDTAEQQRLINTFFTVYPELAKAYYILASIPN